MTCILTSDSSLLYHSPHSADSVRDHVQTNQDDGPTQSKHEDGTVHIESMLGQVNYNMTTKTILYQDLLGQESLALKFAHLPMTTKDVDQAKYSNHRDH